MPELPVTTNVNITRIDAPFPEQWQNELRPLIDELKAIKEMMALVAASMVEDKSGQEEVLKLYSKEAFEERASMVQAVLNKGQQRPVNDQGGEDGVSRPPDAPPPGKPKEQAPEEDENPSRPPNPLDEPIRMPQHYGGKYTAEDFLKLMGKGARWLGNEPSLGGWELPVSKGMEGLASRGSEYFAKGAKLQPNLTALSTLGRTYYDWATSKSEGLGSYAGSLGYEPGGGFLGANNVSGPFGTNFRLPFVNSAALSGIGNIAESYETALNYPGLSGSQVMAINQSLAERGWFPGQKGKEELFAGQAKLLSKGGVFQQLGEDPQVAEMLDRGMRNGTASMEEMVKTVEEIPTAAKAAHEGIGQMVASMQEMGEFSESQGGTRYAGERQALNMAQTTGLPIQATKGLLESPWATSAIFRETGVPSWAQGTIPGAIKNRVATQSFWQLAQSVGKGQGHTYNVGGFEEHVSPLEEQAARIHMINPNMSYEATLKMLREGRTGTLGRQKVAEEAEAWRKRATELMGNSIPATEDEVLTASNVSNQNFGRLLHNMAQLKTAQGHQMFNHKDLWNIRTNEGEGYEGHGQQLVQEKYQELQKVLSEKAGKDSNAAGSPGSVVIELSTAARKLLQLPNKQTRIKLEAGAGENSTNNGYTGYSDGLTPAVNAIQEGVGFGFGHGSGGHG